MSHSSKQKNRPTREEAEKILWERGIIHWKLDANQKEIYDFFKNNDKKITTIASSRQLGKTFMLSLMAIEECMSTPNRVVKMLAPEVKMIKTILRPIFREILQTCPKELQPKLSPMEHIYRFPNGSEIQLAGSDNGNADNIRGTKAHLCIVDEAGFCSDLEYIVQSILIPTTTTTKGRIILSSTPSKSNDHDFMKFWERAELDGSFIKRTIYDNPRLTKEDIDQLAEAMGGYESVGFRREYLCEKITSEEDSVVPEFSHVKDNIVKEWPRPSHFDAYEAMDIGFRDWTVVLFGYYDFRAGKLIIEDEIVIHGRKLLTDDLAKDIKNKEKTLWTNPLTSDIRPVYLRVSDNNNLILLNDLQQKHNITFIPAIKDNNEAAINNMRLMIKQERIIINPRCKTLISHLNNALWNKNRTSYIRTADGAHADSIDALKYLCRSVHFHKNPYPHNFNFNKFDDFFIQKDTKGSTEFTNQLKDIFKIKKFNK